jgi:PTH1 family peptidyl-tRNA hydrolase
VESRAPLFRLIVGLGNPGLEYAQTRHNVGFMILNQLADRAGTSFRSSQKWNAETAVASTVTLCKPLSFMNLSGEPVAALSRYYKIEPREMLMILDDVALPLGKLRLRASGSAGGHNGLQSVIEHLGTVEIPRLRVGIGAAANRPLTSHVLGRFSPDELPALQESIVRAADAVAVAQREGLEAAMNQFNQQPVK